MNKTKSPLTLESVEPCSDRYSLARDLKLNGWLAVAAAAYLGSQLLLHRYPEASTGLRALLALAPLPPGLAYLAFSLRFISRLDELQRRIQLEALLVAAAGTLVVSLAVNLLAEAGVSFSDFKHGLGVGQTALVLFFFWLLGSAFANRRFQ